METKRIKLYEDKYLSLIKQFATNDDFNELIALANTIYNLYVMDCKVNGQPLVYQNFGDMLLYQIAKYQEQNYGGN
jgi:hypothetical protein|nr:MAG TPA: hypothetical protein [Caudoviricetes sp.]